MKITVPATITPTLVALFFLVAVAMPFATASASTDFSGSGSNGGGGNSDNGSANFQQPRLVPQKPQDRIAELERMIAELDQKRAVLQKQLDSLRLLGTSTPTVGQFRVVTPNGGTVFANKTNGSVLIRWIDTYGADTVSISAKHATSAVITIAENIVPNIERSSTEPGAFGALTLASVTTDTPNANGGATFSDTLSNGVRTTMPWLADKTPVASTTNCSVHPEKCRPINPGAPARTYTYVWNNAPIGAGYTVTVTGKKGAATFSDSSDNTFTIAQAPTVAPVHPVVTPESVPQPTSSAWWKGLFENSIFNPHKGEVQGAETSRGEEIDAALTELSTSLTELRDALQ